VVDPQKTKVRGSISVPLSDGAKSALERVASDTRRSQTKTLQTILEAFATLPLAVQNAILSGGNFVDELVNHRLAEMATTGEMPASLEEAIAAADVAYERVKHLARTYQRESSDTGSPTKKKK